MPNKSAGSPGPAATGPVACSGSMSVTPRPFSTGRSRMVIKSAEARLQRVDEPHGEARVALV